MARTVNCEIGGGERLAVAPPEARPQAKSIPRAVGRDGDVVGQVGANGEAPIEAKRPRYRFGANDQPTTSYEYPGTKSPGLRRNNVSIRSVRSSFRGGGSGRENASAQAAFAA